MSKRGSASAVLLVAGYNFLMAKVQGLALKIESLTEKTDGLGDVPGESAEIATTPAEMADPGLPIKELQPLSAAYYELSSPAGQ
jgi:hypothetical protein